MDKGRDRVNVQGYTGQAHFITTITDDPLNISESNKVLCLFEVPQLSCTFMHALMIFY